MMNKDVAEISQAYQVAATEQGVPAGYKQTEVGVIPEDWKVFSVGDAFEICNNLRLPLNAKVREKMAGVYPYYGPTRIQDFINEYRVEGEFALIGEDGDHFLKFDSVPQTQYVTGKFNVNNHAHLVKGKLGTAKWFYLFFRSRDITMHLTRQGAGRFKLNKASLEKILCSVPSTKEQTAIANALSDVDALLSELEKLIAKKQAIKTATMQQLLTGRTRLPQFSLHKDGSPKGFKPSELGEIPEGWEVYSVQELLDRGQLGGNYANSESETDYPLIKMGNLGRGNIKLDKLEYVKIQPDEKDRLNFGDVLFNTRNTLDLVGKVAIWRDELPRAYFNSNLMRLSFNEKLVASNFYINTLFNTKRFISDLAGIATGTTSVAAIYSRDLLTLKIILPSKIEQTAIATILSDMDTELQALEHRLNKTRQIKQGMMQELLTGKTRLVAAQVNK